MNSTSCEHSVAYAAIMMPNMGLLRRLAQVKTQLGKTDDALALAERAVAARPHDISNCRYLATLPQRGGDFEGAEASLLEAIDRQPEDATALRRMSDFTLSRGKVREARLWVVRATEAAPYDALTYNQEASVALASALRPDELAGYNRLAALHLMIDDAPAAEAVLVQAVDRLPPDAAVLRRLSDLLMGRGDEDGVLRWATRLVTDFPNDPVGHVQLASLHQTAGRPADAEAALLRGVEVTQTPAASVLPMHRLSDLAARRGDVAEAFRWSRRAVEAAPNEPKTDMSRLAKVPISTEETRSSGSPARRPGTFEQRPADTQ